MGPAKKLLLIALGAVGLGAAYVKFAAPRVLSQGELEKMAPGAQAIMDHAAPPHGLTVGAPILLAVKTFGGFGLLPAVVTVADPTASIGYASVQAANGHLYTLSTKDEQDAYFDSADSSLAAWASAHGVKTLGL